MFDRSFFYDNDSIAFFSNDDNEDDINEMEACLTLFTPHSSDTKYDDKNLNNITSFTETENYFKDEKIQEKSNVSLNETSFSINIQDEEEADIINPDFLQPKQQIFFIEKMPQKTKKKKASKKKKRKNDADTIRRKIKPYYHKYILDTLNRLIKIKKIKSSQSKNTFLKMNNRITSTVSIEYNKNLLHKSIGNILQSEHISSKYKCYEKDNNFNLIKQLNEINDKDITKVLRRNYAEMYDVYLKSKDYKLLLNKIGLKDGEAYMKQFNEISSDFLKYFIVTEAKKDKITPLNHNEFILEDTELNSFNNLMINNQENYFIDMEMNMNMNSDITQL